MTATILTPTAKFEVAVCGQTILEAIQTCGIDFPAPCGGAGTCGKCQVFLQDCEGLRYVLACKTVLAEGAEVRLDSNKELAVKEQGAVAAYRSFDARTGYGLAIDIGTTTMVCRLHDLETGALLASRGKVNPQVVFGADVITRIKASMEGRLDDMCDLVRSSLDALVDELCLQAGIHREEIAETVVVGNTVVEHLAAGLAPDSIGVAPYQPLSLFGVHLPFEPVSQEAYFSPAISGYVGGDIAAGLLSTRMSEGDGLRLYLDLGTNGELAIGNKDRITCCATAAGPVFEGAGIHFGLAAQPGAISAVSLHANTLELETLGGEPPVGICGSGLIDAIALMLEAGVIDETGRLLGADEVGPAWRPFIAKGERGNRFFLDADRSIYITQGDVRNVQLAKAAICAGILTLFDRYRVAPDDVDGLLIAGGFGSFLDIESAARIGLFPSSLLPQARSVGNMAAEGASEMLLSCQARETAQAIASASEYIELSTSVAFSKYYIECMMM